MDFTVEDLKNFLTTYKGVDDEHEAVRIFWDDLSAETHLDVLADAPQEVRDYLSSALGSKLDVLTGLKSVDSPFGSIVLEDVTTDEDEWFTPRYAKLRIGERLFQMVFCHDEEDDNGEAKMDFIEAPLVEVQERHSLLKKYIPTPGGAVKDVDLSVVPEWTDLKEFKLNDDNYGDYMNAMMDNIIHKMLRMDMNQKSPSANMNDFLYQLRNGSLTFPKKKHVRRDGTVHFSDGNEMVFVSETVHPNENEKYQVHLRYEGLPFILSFRWSSYEGPLLFDATVSEADLELIPTVETVPVSAACTLVKSRYGDGFDFDEFFEPNPLTPEQSQALDGYLGNDDEGSVSDER